jgi:signal peptidase
MTRQIKKILGWVVLLLTGLLGLWGVMNALAPDSTAAFVGYRPYIVLTDSMKTTLPPGTLVIDRTLTEQDAASLLPGDIITFEVNDIQQGEIFTHFYKETQTDADGSQRIRTQSEVSEYYDDYHTSPENLRGKVVLILPFVGRLFLFWKSPFGLMELGVLGIIWLLNTLLWRRFDAEEHLDISALGGLKKIRLGGVHLSGATLRGCLFNRGRAPITNVRMAVTVWYKGEGTPYSYLEDMPPIEPRGRLKWHWPFEYPGDIADYRVRLLPGDSDLKGGAPCVH